MNMKMFNVISSILMVAPLFGTGVTASARTNRAPRIRVIHNRRTNKRNFSIKVAKGPVIGAHHTGRKGFKANMAYFLHGKSPILQNKNFQKVLAVGLSKQGDRYEWGGTGPNRFDCSGLMQYMFKHGMNKRIPRTVDPQCAATHHRVSAKHRQPGDLIKMSNGGHIGMYIGHGYMLDAQNYGVDIERIPAPWWHVNGYYRPAY